MKLDDNDIPTQHNTATVNITALVYICSYYILYIYWRLDWILLWTGECAKITKYPTKKPDSQRERQFEVQTTKPDQTTCLKKRRLINKSWLYDDDIMACHVIVKNGLPFLLQCYVEKGTLIINIIIFQDKLASIKKYFKR